MNFLTTFAAFLETTVATPDTGLKFIAIGLAALSMAASGIGEALVVSKSIDGMSRNPEMYGKLRTSMILGCALVETTAIYALLMAILCLFVA